ARVHAERCPHSLHDALPSYLLINGSSGIAVGMATNIPPHNLREVAAALRHLVAHPDCSVDDLMEHVPGPDFPTGAYILGVDGIRDRKSTRLNSSHVKSSYAV